jgi:hypothetical protein
MTSVSIISRQHVGHRFGEKNQHIISEFQSAAFLDGWGKCGSYDAAHRHQQTAA